MFRNAANLVVIGGQFTNIENGNGQDTTSTALWPHVAHGGIFDSAERYPPGRCHPGTRQEIIERITRWIDDPDPTHHILWLHGPAGSGKSAIGQSLCELLRQYHPDRYGGSFFFSKGNTDRGKAFKLFTTLAYQLAVHLPSLRTEINEALCRDQSLPTKSMDVQLYSLIIQPLLRCPSFPLHSPTLIIDGLDECADDQGMDTQRRIIELISESIIEHHIPLRFMIASRPEFWIRDTFETSPLPEITLSLSLREDKDADKDIAAYLTQGFEKIRVENKRIMASVKLPWPPVDVINHFVYEASGQYVYASTVLKFVGKSSRFSDPQEQLCILTSPGPHRASAFSELDRLYETIIRAYPRWATMKRVLGGLLVQADSTVIESILGVTPSELTFVLDALSSLIDVKRPRPLSGPEVLLEPIFGSLSAGQEGINFCHLSFREFLQDKLRSGQFHIDVRDIYSEIMSKYFGIVHQNIEQNYNTEPTLCIELGLVRYKHAMSNMSKWVLRPQVEADLFDGDALLQLLHDTTQKLHFLDPDKAMFLYGFFIDDMEGIMTFRRVRHGANVQHRLGAFIHAFANFEETFRQLWRRHFQILSSRNKNDFNITPVLTYLAELCSRRTLPVIEDPFSVPWHTIPDVLSTFQQHRHLFELTYMYPSQTWVVYIRFFQDEWYTAPSNYPFRHPLTPENDEWRARGEWKHQRSLLAYRYLDLFLLIGFDSQKIQYNYLADFFRSPTLSGIRNQRYFQNPCNLAILTSMVKCSTWASLPAPETELQWREVTFFLISVFWWFNCQLTNSETLKLLDDHDKSLAPKMRNAANDIFDHHFFPHFMKALNDSIMDRTPISGIGWHPYLGLRDLDDLIRFSYNDNAEPLFGIAQQENLTKQLEVSSRYILNGLSRAMPTRDNLDALQFLLKILKYTERRWCPPPHFGVLSLEFLNNFDRSSGLEHQLNEVESIVKALYRL